MNTRTVSLSLWLSLFACVAWGEDEVVRPSVGQSVTNSNCTTSTAPTTLDDDPDSPGGDWCTATANNDHHDILTHVGNPTCTVSSGTDAQVWAGYVRRTNNSAASPDFLMSYYDGGSCGTLNETGATNSVSSTTGELFTDAWTFDGPDSDLVCVELDGNRTGGAPGSRNTVEYDAVEWRVTCAAAGRGAIITLHDGYDGGEVLQIVVGGNDAPPRYADVRLLGRGYDNQIRAWLRGSPMEDVLFAVAVVQNWEGWEIADQ